MPCIEKRIHSGKVTEIYKFNKIPCSNYSKSTRRNVTPEQMKKVNIRNAILKCERLIRCNFKDGDYHLTFTYSKINWGQKGPTDKQAKKEYNKFMRKLRNHYKKIKKEFKYIAVTEYESNRIHHHIILEKIDVSILQEFWCVNGNVHITPLYADGDYKQLAEYLVKETREKRENPTIHMFKKRWNSSKNLKKPIEEEPKQIKRGDLTTAPKEVIGMSKGFKKYSGYKLLEQKVGVHEITGYPYSYWKVIDYSKK